MRITGGVLRSRQIAAPRGLATRPTSDRVREALFSILDAQVTLDGARILDLFCGSGALALEAISRGASRAVLVDRARPAVLAARANARALGVEAQVDVRSAPVERALRELASESAAFDLAFADPPYADAGAAVQALAGGGLAARLAPGGLLVFEHAARDESAERIDALVRRAVRVYGDTALSFYAPET